jgi:hypothetical protein
MNEAAHRLEFFVWRKRRRRALVSLFEARGWLEEIGYKGSHCDHVLTNAAESLAREIVLAGDAEQRRRKL